MRKTLVAILAIAGTMSTAAYAAEREAKVDDRLDASAETDRYDEGFRRRYPPRPAR